MLTEATITCLKASIPLILEHGEQITAKMYTILFERYPQTKPLFARAPKNQHEILAHSIITYCKHVDNLPMIWEELEKIAIKHVSADVHAGYYPMVGHSLLQAFKEVLGEKATPELLTAWKEAYFYLADVLINREHQLFTERKKCVGV